MNIRTSFTQQNANKNWSQVAQISVLCIAGTLEVINSLLLSYHKP
jgi:hypothetical protein